MSEDAKIPPSILDQVGKLEDLSDETRERFGRLLRISSMTAAERDAVSAAARSDAAAVASAARWANHDVVQTTPVRVASHIVERLKAEIPKPERRSFVDRAILCALDSTHVKQK